MGALTPSLFLLRLFSSLAPVMVTTSRFFSADLFGKRSEFSRVGLSATLAAGHLCRVEGGRNEGAQGQKGILRAGANPVDGAGSRGAVILEGLRAGQGRTRRLGALLEEGHPHCDLVAEYSGKRTFFGHGWSVAVEVLSLALRGQSYVSLAI